MIIDFRTCDQYDFALFIMLILFEISSQSWISVSVFEDYGHHHQQHESVILIRIVFVLFERSSSSQYGFPTPFSKIMVIIIIIIIIKVLV